VLQSHYHQRVVPYTVDDEQTMQRVIDLGVDGIISDDVDLLLRVAAMERRRFHSSSAAAPRFLKLYLRLMQMVAAVGNLVEVIRKLA
jgi:DNA-binding NarL/FixJ family response regulator